MSAFDQSAVRLAGGGLLVLVVGYLLLSGSGPAPIPESCTENWQCTEWGPCSNNVQSRTCRDIMACGTLEFQPALVRACTNPTPSFVCGDFICQPEMGESCRVCAGDCGACPDEYESNNVKVSVTLGAEETVFDYLEEACATLDLPDVQAHAFRDEKGKIVLVSGNAPNNYWSKGPGFNQLARVCTSVLRSPDEWDFDEYKPMQWIASAYTEDGKKVHALVHNEYHDPHSPDCKPGDTQPSNPCWYNFISYAVSNNGGASFTQPAAPQNVAAILPYAWDPTPIPTDRGGTRPPSPHGYFSPSNIVKGNDGFYYVLFNVFPTRSHPEKSGQCLMRTNTLDQPAEWKIWDGASFSIPRTIPASGSTEVENQPSLCAFVSPENIRGMGGSLTYNTYLEKYLLVGADVFPNASGTPTCGFWLSLSGDLIHWGKPQLIKETTLGWAPCDKPNAYQKAHNITQEAYPSIIDPDSTDASFTTADNTVYLYFMENMDNHQPGGWGLRRNLVRVPITFTKEN